VSDYNALLNAIHLHPDEDVPRLALADWYDEWAEMNYGAGQWVIEFRSIGDARTFLARAVAWWARSAITAAPLTAHSE
jgi:uncharacterized protein (TIGR02996 family)